MLIMILFHNFGYRCLKHCYLSQFFLIITCGEKTGLEVVYSFLNIDTGFTHNFSLDEDAMGPIAIDVIFLKPPEPNVENLNDQLDK